MIIVADSGSTKTDWILIDGETSYETETIGFNPVIQDQSFIASHVEANDMLQNHRESISAIYFYGAGCSSDVFKNVIKKGLEPSFPNVVTWQISHDLEGAAIALCGSEVGIACILGTGSNSCYFDGKKTSEVIPALGYILGDEGSGSFFGKVLLTDYLYKRLPANMQAFFSNELKLHKDLIFDHVYKQPNPKRYLASFAKYLSQFRSEEYVQNLLQHGFNEFADTHILCYPNYREVPVHFVGSVAFYFQEELRKVAVAKEFTVGNIIQKPIDRLVDFYGRA